MLWVRPPPSDHDQNTNWHDVPQLNELTANRVCTEPGCQLNTVGVAIGFPSTVASSAPCGNESTVMPTFVLVLTVRVAVEVTDVAVAFVVLVVVLETAASRKSSISAMLCFGTVNILDAPAARKVRQSIHNFIFHWVSFMPQSPGQILGRFTAKHANRRYNDLMP